MITYKGLILNLVIQKLVNKLVTKIFSITKI